MTGAWIAVAAVSFAVVALLVWDRLRLRLPVVGRAVRLISISRFSRTLSTLLSGGVPIVRALEIASTTSGN